MISKHRQALINWFLQQEPATLEDLQGPPGPPGEDGEDGAPGPAAGVVTDAQYRAMILADLPAHYWPLDEAAGAATAIDLVSPGGIALDYANTPSYREAGPFGDGSFGVGLDGDHLVKLNQSFLTPGKTNKYTLEIWFRNAADLDDAGLILMLGTGANGVRLGMSGGGDFTTVGRYLTGLIAGVGFLQPKLALLPRPAWHHLVLVVHDGAQETATNGYEFWVDGRRLVMNNASAPGALAANGQHVQIGEAVLSGRYAHCALYDRVLPATRILAHASALRP